MYILSIDEEILFVKRLGGFLLLLVLLIPAATAATITISPDRIASGDTVTVDVSDLPDGASFSLGIRGEFAATPGETFAFSAREITFPFSLTSGEVNAYTKGTNWTELSAEFPDGGSASMRQNADKNNEVRLGQPRNIGSGTLPLATLRGVAAERSIIADLTVLGTKQGPDAGRISFAIEGIEQGTATVTIYVDGAQALSRTIPVGVSPTPTQTTTPTATATQSSGGNGGNGGGSTGPAPTATSTAATPATVTSADGKASLTGTDISGAGLLKITAQGTAPAGWAFAGNAYAVTPEGRTFNPSATLSFSLPSADTTGTIARFENGAWSPVPSRVEGDRITAAVSRSGSYVLLVTAPAAEATATTTVTAATATTAAPAATTPAAAAPVAPLLAVAGLLAGLALVLRRR